VYEQHHNPTSRMDAWVKDIHFWTSPCTTASAKLRPIDKTGDRRKVPQLFETNGDW
jgi:hypothetical protein